MGGYTPGEDDLQGVLHYIITDRNISLTGPDWLNELNFIKFSDENEAYQTPTLEQTNAENLVRGCN
ncbi:unnamed protein product [Hymenolepis diminuta]|nr:unnamed protein product [Hymenolepis diminuta]